MPWRPKVPSPTWRSFLHNHLTEFAAIDMFVVAKPRTGKRNQRDPGYSQKHPVCTENLSSGVVLMKSAQAGK